jgi:DNA adenine methylase
MTAITRPVMRYHGGKFRLAPWIISHFPTHTVYVEPFGGAASVLMRKPRSHGEVYNDLDGEVVNVMRVLRDDALRNKLIEALAFTLYACKEFELAWESSDDPVERARRTLIRAEMGFGSAGATKNTTGFRIDTKRNSCNAMRVWARIPDRLAAFGQRLQGVLIENRPAFDVLTDHDTENTLFYVDPPYVHSTRKMRYSAYYRHEMRDEDHQQLLTAMLELEGMVILSGYSHAMYENMLGGWQRVETQSSISGNRGAGIRTEVLWISPRAARVDLFRSAA